jgi:hypothetical protein
VKRIAITVILVFWITSPALAQQMTCGHGVPCGPIPWQLPDLPILIPPTPFPTISFTATPTASDTPDVTPTDPPTPTDTSTPTDTPTPTDTATSVPSPTPFMDMTDIAGQVETLTAALSATPVSIADADDIEDTADDLASDAGSLFGYIRGLTLANFGVLTPLIVFLMTALSFTMLVKFTELVLPMVVLGFGLLRKLVQLILDFIPG